MLEEFEIKNNLSREKVIDYIRKSKFKLEYFIVKDYLEYPGGIELLNKDNRSIIIYYDTIFEEIKVIYKELKLYESDIYTQVKYTLWAEYSTLSEETHQVARIKRKNGMIQFYRYDVDNPKNITHTSKEFHEASQLYDIYYYLKRQIRRMEVEKEELF